MTENKKLTDKRHLIPFALITTLFFLWGFARAILDVLNKHLQNEMDITIAHSALIQVTTYLGYFLMAIPAGMLINRHGYRRGVVFGLSLFGAGAFLFIPGAQAASFPVFLIALFVIGCGLVCLETAANPYVTELGAPETATSRLNFSQSFNGLGGLFATLAVGQFFFSSSSQTNSVAIPYTVLGIIVLGIAVLFGRVSLPEIKHQDETENQRTRSSRMADLLWRRPMFRFGLIALLCYEVSEISINSYFINFVTGQGWMSDSMASVVLTCALGFFMIGRFAGSWVMRRTSPARMLTVCGAGTVICTATVLCDAGKISMVALVANYFFESIMFPTIFALALRDLGSLTKSASSLLMMTPIGGCGFLLMGWLADTAGMVVPFLIPLIGYIIVLSYALKVRSKEVKA